MTPEQAPLIVHMGAEADEWLLARTAAVADELLRVVRRQMSSLPLGLGPGGAPATSSGHT